jgi:hypothetical protein
LDRHEGLDILIDFGLYEDESETKHKIKQNKKTGKLLGGKLLKQMSTEPEVEPVPLKHEGLVLSKKVKQNVA